MNKLALLVVVSFMLSCSHKMNLNGNYSRNFSREEIKQLNTHGGIFIKTKVIIGGVVVNNKKKIGLYTYQRYTYLSAGVKCKLLKFESKIVFASNDLEQNKLIFSQFQTEYSKYFTSEQMEKMKESFLKGTELIGRFL